MPFGNFYQLSYEIDETQESTGPLDVDTEAGRAALHSALDEALNAGATPITVAKPE